MIRVYRGNACLEHQKNLRKLALQQPGSQGKDTRIGVQPRSNSYRRSGFSRVFLEWSQVAKLWSKSWVHGLTRLCLFGWKWFGADMLGTSNYRYMFFFIYIRRVFCSLIHISLASNAILRRLFEACRLEVHWVLPERRHEVSVSPLAEFCPDFDHYLSVSPVFATACKQMFFYQNVIYND